MDRRPKAGEFYRHFKDKMYQIIAVAKHSETGEELVIYQALYGSYGVYARPLAMFVSEVDHEKYPDVSQKYRFEKVELPQAAEKTQDSHILKSQGREADECHIPESKNEEKETVDDSLTALEEASFVEEEAEGGVNAKLMEFLDAESFDEKYNVLVSMRDCIDDKLIDDIAVVMDVVIPEGELTKRYDDLKQSIRTRQKYEFANRLR